MFAAAIAMIAATLAAASAQDAAPPATASPTEADATAPAADGQPNDYLDLRRIRPVSGDAAAGQAKSEVCSACHGPAGISIAPAFPNIAGQGAEYLYWQLVYFRHVGPEMSPMAPLVATLSDEDMRDLASYYASLPSAPTIDPAAPPAEAAPAPEPPDPALVQTGEQLYLHGAPDKGIPPCQGCHGSDARGNPAAHTADANGDYPFLAFPALRGQQGPYLQAKLAEFRDGKHVGSTNGRTMNAVGSRLDDDSIQALSAWLSTRDP